jgi:hypothetical protein
MTICSNTVQENHTYDEIKIGSIYRHYKGNQYKVIAIARDTEDTTKLHVIYQGLYTCPTFGANPIWARPYSMFIEPVTINGILRPRFELTK